MALSYTKKENENYLVFRPRLKERQLYSVVMVFIALGILGAFISQLLSGLFFFLLLIFSAVYGLSAWPMARAQQKAFNSGRKITVQKKDGFREIWIEK